MHRLVPPLILGLALASAMPSRGSDTVPGGDTLPFLAREATRNGGGIFVVKDVQASDAVEDSPARSFTAKVEQRLSVSASANEARASVNKVGPLPQPGETVVLLVFGDTTTQSPPDTSPKLVFLQAPIADGLARDFLGGRAPIAGPFLVVVSGRAGIVDLEPGRLEATREYLEGDERLRFAWAANFLGGPDPWLQRSAIQELSQQSRVNPNREASSLLASSLNSKAVTPRNKALAITAARAQRMQAAFKPLLNLANNPDEPRPLRSTAMQGLFELPGGPESLSMLAVTTNDDWARAEASAYRGIERSPAAYDRSPFPHWLMAALRDKKESVRLRAAEQARASRYSYSDELGNALVAMVANPEEPLSHRRAALEALGDFHDPGSARLLAEIAAQDAPGLVPDSLRRSAILALGRMKTKFSEEWLRKLEGDLKSPDLAAFARALLAKSSK